MQRIVCTPARLRLRLGCPVRVQGDVERAAGIPISPMMDRSTTGRGSSQVGRHWPGVAAEFRYE